MKRKVTIPLLALASVVFCGAELTQTLKDSNAGFFSAFLASFMLILGSEVGDKTFFIAAIMSMRNSHTLVFAGAISALVLMTVLSAGMGVLLPAFLSTTLTHYACILLFAFFGFRLLHDVYTSEPGEGENEELKEVELELAASPDVESSQSPTGLTAPRDEYLQIVPGFISELKSWLKSTERKRVFFQAFLLTFLAEWGDRSQIATIALASSKDAIGVTLGGVFGHALCTGVAVVGGKLLATRISERQVNLVGGCLFLFFAVVSFVMGH